MLAERLVPELPYLAAVAVFAIRHEIARTVSDVLTRPIPARLLNAAAAAQAAPRVADLLASELAIPRDQVDRQVADFRADVSREAAELRGTGEASDAQRH